MSVDCNECFRLHGKEFDGICDNWVCNASGLTILGDLGEFEDSLKTSFKVCIWWLSGLLLSNWREENQKESKWSEVKVEVKVEVKEEVKIEMKDKVKIEMKDKVE